MGQVRRHASWWMIVLIGVLAVTLGYYFNVAEQNDAERTQALNRLSQWKQLIDNSTAAIIVVDDTGAIVMWNHGASDMLGWHSHDIVGSDLSVIIPPDRYPKHQRGFDDPVMRKQLEEGKIIQVNGYVLDKHGEIHYVNIRVSCIHNGHVLYVAQMVPVQDLENISPAPSPPTQEHYPPPDPSKFRQPGDKTSFQFHSPEVLSP